jgi:hypothetical protein
MPATFRIALPVEIKDAPPRCVKNDRAAMNRKARQNPKDVSSSLTLNEAQAPYKADVWRKLTPGERLRRSWQMRSRIPDLQAVHDRKLFPQP